MAAKPFVNYQDTIESVVFTCTACPKWRLEVTPGGATARRVEEAAGAHLAAAHSGAGTYAHPFRQGGIAKPFDPRPEADPVIAPDVEIEIDD